MTSTAPAPGNRRPSVWKNLPTSTRTLNHLLLLWRESQSSLIGMNHIYVLISQFSFSLWSYGCSECNRVNSYFIAGCPKAALLFGSLVILDVVCRYLLLFLLYIDIKIGKNRC